jgi:hypothetical protein
MTRQGADPQADAADADVRVYTAPPEEVPTDDFEVTVDGRAAFTYAARVSAVPLNEFCRTYQRPLDQTEVASFVAWEQAAPVNVVVRSRRPVESVRVRPKSAELQPTVDGDVIRFTIERPGQYTVEVNGVHRALHVFADAPEEPAPDPGDPDVLYFEPGVHCAGIIRLQSGQTVYLAPGSVVYGAILGEGANDVTVRGRGILDGSKFGRFALTGLVCLYDCDNVRFEGITLRDAPIFTMIPMNCRELRIRNVKIIGNWRYNSDGINFSNCQRCSVEDSFLRTFDDSICIKGYANFGPFLYRLRLIDGLMDDRYRLVGMEGAEGTFADLQDRYGQYPSGAAANRDIRIHRCVVWCDWGRPLEIGAETVAEEIVEIVYEDCDLIHVPMIAMSVQNCDRAVCRNIVYRDIRVELDDEPRRPFARRPDRPDEQPKLDVFVPGLIKLANQVGYVTYDTVRGRIEDIRFENIAVSAPSMPLSQLMGHDDEHLVQRVTIENLRLNGEPVTDLERGGFQMNEFVRNVELRTGDGE